MDTANYKNKYVVNHIQSPLHSSDDSTSIISVIVNWQGELEKVTILVDLKDSCEDGTKWEIGKATLKLDPIYSKETKNYTEYIVKRYDISFYECLVDPDTKSGN